MKLFQKLLKSQKKKKKTLLVEQTLFLLHYKETLTTTSHEIDYLPNGVKKLLKEFDDLFPEEGHMGYHL